MSSFKQKRKFKKATHQIAHGGFGSLLREFKLEHHLPFRSFLNRELLLRQAPDPPKLAQLLIDLGPGFIEAARIVASRGDVVPQAYQNKLLNITWAPHPMDAREREVFLRKQLQKNPDEIFSHIDETPAFSFLLGYAYPAILHDGRRVLLVMQDQRARDKLLDNVAIITQSALEPVASSMEGKMQLIQSACEELALRAALLGDLTMAAGRMEMLAAQFGRGEKVSIPDVLWEYTTPHLLCQRWHKQPTLDDAIRSSKSIVSEHYAARYLVEAMVRQYGICGVFLLRPHARDIGAGAKNSLVFNNAVNTGLLEPAERARFCAVLFALAQGNTNLAAKVLLSFHYERAPNRPLHESGLVAAPDRPSSLADDLWMLIDEAWEGKVYVPLSITMAAESVLHLEYLISHLSGEVDFRSAIGDAIKKSAAQLFGAKKGATAETVVARVLNED